MLEQFSCPLRVVDSNDSLKSGLKTYLFSKARPATQLTVRRPCNGIALLRRHINCHYYYYTEGT